MTDWADERVRRFRLGMIRYNGTEWVTAGEAAEALRDVERETAEECVCVCEAQANRDDDCEFSTTVCHNMDAAKIREYLPKEKP